MENRAVAAMTRPLSTERSGAAQSTDLEPKVDCEGLMMKCRKRDREACMMFSKSCGRK